MKRLHRWVLWRLEPRGVKNGTVEYAKVPYLGAGRKANVAHGPWLTFEQAKATFEGNPNYFHGLGVVLGDGLLGVDLDDCLDENGNPLGWAQWVLERCGGYAEISPSRKGVKVFMHFPGAVKFPASKKLKHIELYSGSRFFTVTGHALFERPASPETLEELFERAALIDLAAEICAGRHGEKLQKLFTGEWHGLTNSKGELLKSDSEADNSLVVHLVHMGKTPEEVDFLFRLSALMRPKWDERHRSDGATYGQLTIEKAFQLVEESKKSSKERRSSGQGGEEPKRRFVLRTFAEIEHEFCEPQFLIHPILPRREITLLDGEDGVGKTWLCLALAAGLTGSKVCPVPYDHTAPRDARVIILTTEDDFRTTMGPRLKALGADLSKIGFFDLQGDEEALVNGVTAAELEEVMPAIKEFKPDLIVIDHLTIYETTAWDHTASRAPLNVAARKILGRLVKLARELNCAVLVVRHFRKKGGSAGERGSGSHAYKDSSRSHLIAGEHPTREGVYCLRQRKMNLTSKLKETLTYTLDENDWPPFKWLGTDDVPADALTDPQVAERIRREETERNVLAEALLEVLSGGEEVESGEVVKEVRKITGRNYSEDHIRRVARSLGVDSRLEGFRKERKSYWFLPPAHRPGNPRAGNPRE